MLVHPNTGYEYEDHSIWAMWAGDVWPLDMSIFDKETQTNEFGVWMLFFYPFTTCFFFSNWYSIILAIVIIQHVL
jgi:hypothetical protein